MPQGQQIELKLTLDDKQFTASIGNSNQLIKQLRSQVGSTTKSLSDWGNIVTGFNQALELSSKFTSIFSAPLRAAGQIEQYEAQLNVMLGSTEAAKSRLEELVQFAATTPFELPQVVQAGNKLEALGEFSLDTLENLGDLAAAAGKPFDQVLSAFSKLVSGQKGIAVDMFRDLLITTDDWVEFTGAKLGANGELQATVEQMAAALPEIIMDKGFSGMMDEQAKTLNGMLSNFSDAWFQLQSDVGTTLLPIAKDIVTTLTDSISVVRDNYEDLIPIVRFTAITIAAYSLAIYGAEAAAKAHAIATGIAQKVTALFNKTISANPIGLFITGIIGLTAALYELTDGFNITTMALKDEIETREDEIKARRSAIDAQKAYIDNQMKEAERSGASAEELQKYKDELQAVSDVLKQIAVLEALNKVQQQASEYVDSLVGDFEMLVSSVGPAGAKLRKQEQDALDALTTGTVEQRIQTAQNLMETASAEQQVMLGNLIKSLLAYKDTMGEVFTATGEESVEGVEKISQEIITERESFLQKIDDKNQKAKLKEETNSRLSSMTIAEIENEKNAAIKNAAAIREQIAQASTNKELERLKDEYELAQERVELTDSELGQRKKSFEDFQHRLTELRQKDIDDQSYRNQSVLDLNNDYLSEKQNLADIELELLTGDLTEAKFNDLEDEKEITEKKLDLIQSEVDKRIELANLRYELFGQDQENEVLREEEDAIRFETWFELQDMKAEKEFELLNIKNQIMDLETQKLTSGLTAQQQLELNDLNTKKNFTTQELELINQTVKAREEQTKQSAIAFASSLDTSHAFGTQLGNFIRQRIRAYAVEAVAGAVSKTLASVPFPFNIILAAAAAGATALAFDTLVPKFAAGGVVRGSRHFHGGVIVEAEDEEFIVNRNSSIKNRQLLNAINDDSFSIADFIVPSVSELRYINVVNATTTNIKGFDAIIDTIEDQTERLEKVERNVSLSLQAFDEQYHRFKELGL